MFIESLRTWSYIWIACVSPEKNIATRCPVANIDYLLPLCLDIKQPIFLLLKIIAFISYSI